MNASVYFVTQKPSVKIILHSGDILNNALTYFSPFNNFISGKIAGKQNNYTSYQAC